MPTTTETKSANERIALLLGWSRDDHRVPRWLGPNGEMPRFDHAPPDYTQWDRFPGMQEYVRGLPAHQVQAIEEWLWQNVDPPRRSYVDIEAVPMVWDITPTILRDAILEVVG